MAKQMSSDREASPVHLLSSSGELRGQSRHNLNLLLFANGGSRGLKTWRLPAPPTCPVSALLLRSPVLSSWEFSIFKVSVLYYNGHGSETKEPTDFTSIRLGAGDNQSPSL